VFALRLPDVPVRLPKAFEADIFNVSASSKVPSIKAAETPKGKTGSRDEPTNSPR
jgi:hypothetical protein